MKKGLGLNPGSFCFSVDFLLKGERCNAKKRNFILPIAIFIVKWYNKCNWTKCTIDFVHFALLDSWVSKNAVFIEGLSLPRRG